MKISAALVSYKRQYHLPAIVEQLRSFEVIDDIVIFQNGDPPTPEVLAMEWADVRVLHSEVNKCTFGRFIAAWDCDHDLVFLQDDDLLVHNVDWLLKTFLSFESERIVANLADDGYSNHWEYAQRLPQKHVELGFGSIIPRRWIAALSHWPGDRELLYRKADKIFTVMYPFHSIRAGADDLTRLFHDNQESGRDPNSLWLRNDHKRLTREAVNRTLDWMLEFESWGSLPSSPSALLDPPD